jgi:hypothetical protein
MPLGNTSTQFWTPTVFTSQIATTYKNNLDGDSSIAANVAGALYVYPNNPVAMNVLVDPGFNLPQVGASTPELLNGAATPVTVSVVAPGSNSYYACIYWDVTTSTAGVIYGASGASPTPLYPDNFWRIPLAFVLIASTDVTIVASKIYDARTWLPPRPLALYSSALSANTSFSCGAASALYHYAIYSAAITITYNALPMGVPVSISVKNSQTSALVIKIAANIPAGTAYTAQTKEATGALGWTDMTATGISVPAGAVWNFTGYTTTGPFLNTLNG